MNIQESKFSFNISLSVLNHLGRSLYRNFITILGEAISNSWDADAENVWIYIDKAKGILIVKDDGIGMSEEDFQSKFLKIGYSKRKDGTSTTPSGRSYIGRKGIGKLALLSCSEKITIASKTDEMDQYVGGVIDNSDLDEAITKELEPQQYQLGTPAEDVFSEYVKDHKHGTIICFENIKQGIRNTPDYLKQMIAYSFRFSLLDKNFHIYFNNEEITLNNLKALADQTQFIWIVNNYKDSYITDVLTALKKREHFSVKGLNIKGFVASVIKPSHLKIRGTDEKVTIDLFVNGRLRERNILKHIPTDQLAESYLYGQIWFNDLDDEEDRFTSSREGIVADDEKYKKFLEILKSDIILKIVNQWDKLRTKNKQDGDPENSNLTKKKRASLSLYHAVSQDYDIPEKTIIDDWINSLSKEAEFNFPSYAECFISENLIRKYITENNHTLSQTAKSTICELKDRESESKGKANISIEIRQENELSYLSMNDLANSVDKLDKNIKSSLSRDAIEYKPFRDALMHTALLTDEAKQRLTTIYRNIVARVKSLLGGNAN